MALLDRIFGIVVMIAIIAFACIHLGISIAIIVQFGTYDNVFRPQIGLSSFNIAISFFAFVTGIAGLVALIVQIKLLGRITAAVSLFLGICATASVITALVINAKSTDYVFGRIYAQMMSYSTNSVPNNVIDKIQYDYQCCGADKWLDWSNIPVNKSYPTSTTTMMMPTTMMTTTMMMATTTMMPTTMMNTTAVNSGQKRSIEDVPSYVEQLKRDVGEVFSQNVYSSAHNLRKRQMQSGTSGYGGVPGLPISFSVLLPGSCCTANANCVIFDQTYIQSVVNGTPSSVDWMGCASIVNITASKQAMGFGVINSFLAVLAFVAIPLLFQKESYSA